VILASDGTALLDGRAAAFGAVLQTCEGWFEVLPD
jgi:hypothetical protein